MAVLARSRKFLRESAPAHRRAKLLAGLGGPPAARQGGLLTARRKEGAHKLPAARHGEPLAARRMEGTPTHRRTERSTGLPDARHAPEARRVTSTYTATTEANSGGGSVVLASRTPERRERDKHLDKMRRDFHRDIKLHRTLDLLKSSPKIVRRRLRNNPEPAPIRFPVLPAPVQDGEDALTHNAVRTNARRPALTAEEHGQFTGPTTPTTRPPVVVHRTAIDEAARVRKAQANLAARGFSLETPPTDRGRQLLLSELSDSSIYGDAKPSGF